MNRPCSILAMIVPIALAVTVPDAVGADAPRRLSDAGTPLSDIYDQVVPQVSPDGRRVVYIHDPVNDNANELYSVGRYGGTPVRLSAQLQTGFSVRWFGISGDSSRVVYLVDQETQGKPELWSVPIGGPSGSSIKISPPLPSFGGVFTGTLPSLSPDGNYVVFFADSTTDGVAEVWSARVDGSGDAVRLSPNPVSGGGATFVLGGPLQVTADSTRVVFTGDFQFDERNELWSAPLDGSAAAVKLNFIADQLGADVTSFALTPDGSQVLYLYDRAIDDRFELFRIPVTGGGGAQLSPTSITSPTSDGDVTSFVISPDSTRAVFGADIQVDSRFDLWSVPLSGSSAQAVIVSPTLVAGREVSKPVFSPDSSRVVFLADAGTNNVNDLWSTPADGSAAAARLNPAIASTADVVKTAFAADGGRVVYEVVDSSPDPDQSRLWTVPAEGPLAAAVELTSSVLSTRSISRWKISGDDTVLMIGALVDATDRELYRVPADGSMAWQTLASSNQASVIDANFLYLSSSGAYATFTTTTTTGQRILDVRVDGSALALPLDLQPPNATSGVANYLVWPTPVGDGVLYVGDYEVDGRYDLWIFDHTPARIFADGFEP